MGNSRQLMLAWIQYYNDSDDQLVNNYGGQAAAAEAQSIGGAPPTYRNWVNDYMTWQTTDPLGNPVTDTNGITKAPFYKYAGSLRIYKCPADNYVSAQQRAAGITSRPRSYAMNMFFGYNTNPKQGSLTYNTFYPTYRLFLKAGSIPNPAGLYVTLDEHADSINDGFLTANPHTDIPPTQWQDLPASYHGGAGGFAFADGHAEIHKFTSTLCTILPVQYKVYGADYPQVPFDAAGVADGLWVAARTSVPQ